MVHELAVIKRRGTWLLGIVAAAGAELWSSYWMLHSIPSDTILDYYPTTWSYVGEHFLTWIIVAFPMFTLFCGTHWYVSGEGKLRDFMTIACISIVAEILSSAYLWFVATPVGAMPKLWWKGGFGTYLVARSPS